MNEHAVSTDFLVDLKQRVRDRLESRDQSIDEFCRYAELCADLVKALTASEARNTSQGGDLQKSRTQLAACLMAAEGRGERVDRNAYGWSLAYELVKELREDRDALKVEIEGRAKWLAMYVAAYIEGAEVNVGKPSEAWLKIVEAAPRGAWDVAVGVGMIAALEPMRKLLDSKESDERSAEYSVGDG